MITIVKHLLNSGSKAMNVNGETPVTFSYSPSSGTVAVIGLTLVLEDAGATGLGSFGALSALSNGVEVSCTIGGNSTVMMLLKDNADLCTAFSFSQVGSGAVSTLGAPIGFGDSADLIVASLIFRSPLLLTDSDSIQAKVQDNISGLGAFQMDAVIEVEQ